MKEEYPGTVGIYGHRISGARKYTGKLGTGGIKWTGGSFIPWDYDFDQHEAQNGG